MVYKFATLALAGLVLAGCEMAEITQPVVDVTRKPALAPERVTGLSDTVLRSFVVEADTRKELSGVPCSVESGEFTAQVTTPVQMRLPRVAGRPSQAVVTCQYGDQTDRVVAAPTYTYSRSDSLWGSSQPSSPYHCASVTGR